MSCSPLKFSLILVPATLLSLNFHIFSELVEMSKVLNGVCFA